MKNKWPMLCLMPICLLVWMPLVMLISGALTGKDGWMEILFISGEYIRFQMIPHYPTLAPLVEVLLDTPAFFHMFWNSGKIVFPVMAGQLLAGTPAAWALTRLRFPGRQTLGLLYTVLMLLPFQVTMVSGYLVMDGLGLLNSYWAIILPGVFSPFAVFIMMRGFSGVPEAVLEAARIDGAGQWRVFFFVGLPLGAPGVLSAAVLGFLEYWSMLEQPMTFLKDKGLWPVSLFLPPVTASTAGTAFVASLLIAAPPLLVFLFGQSDLERGIVTAGLKE